MRVYVLLLVLLPGLASAQDLTLATFNCEWLIERQLERKFVHASPAIDDDDPRWADDAFRAARLAEAAGHVADVLVQTGADVLALTEVGDADDVAVLSAALDARGAPYPFVFVGDSSDPTGQHVAVLSQLPLSAFHETIPGRAIYLNEPDDPETEDDTGLSKALRVTVDAGGRPVVLYVAHLIAERGGYEADAQRLAQAEVLRRHMLPALMADSLVVVAGDLNDARGQPPLHALRGLHDPFPDLIQTGLSRYFADDAVGTRWTYEFDGERNQIDHILVSYGVKDATRRNRGIEARTLDHGDPLASDHRPLIVTLHFRN